MLELHDRVKNATQNLNDFNVIAKLSEGNMVTSDAKSHLNWLTPLYRQEKKTNFTHCDDEYIMKGTFVFSFDNTASTRFEVSTLTNPAPELTITTSLFQMLQLNVFVTNNVFARFRNSLIFTLGIRN